jgi:hypothetical protein
MPAASCASFVPPLGPGLRGQPMAASAVQRRPCAGRGDALHRRTSSSEDCAQRAAHLIVLAISALAPSGSEPYARCLAATFCLVAACRCTCACERRGQRREIGGELLACKGARRGRTPCRPAPPAAACRPPHPVHAVGANAPRVSETPWTTQNAFAASRANAPRARGAPSTRDAGSRAPPPPALAPAHGALEQSRWSEGALVRDRVAAGCSAAGLPAAVSHTSLS